MTTVTLTQLAPLAAFLFTDDKGKYARAVDIHHGKIDFELNSGVTFQVEEKQIPFKVKPGYHVYFNDGFEAIAFDAPKNPVKAPKVAKSTHGSGSITVRSQAL